MSEPPRHVPAILIVDDQPEARLAMRTALAPIGADITEAGDGSEALPILNRRRFDIVVTDLHMPKVDGMLLLETVKSAGLDTDVLVVSGAGSIASAVLAVRMGAANFIEKPVRADQLRREVESILLRRGAKREPPRDKKKWIGRYAVHSTLGRGGMGQVYDCVDPSIDRRVAIKTFDLRLAEEEGARDELMERFRREAHVAGTLQHPNIVTVYDFGEDRERGVLYLVMEHVTGRSLREVLDREGPLPPARALSIAYQAADALGAAHRAGVVHRDVKPTNILVAEGDRVKVVDFGIAGVRDSKITQPGMMVGSIYYMSPEMLRGEPIDGRLDQFALGIVLYEMLSVARPFVESSFERTAQEILGAAPPELKALGVRVHRKVQKLVSKLLAKHPDLRFATGRALLEEIAGAAKKYGLTLSPARPE